MSKKPAPKAVPGATKPTPNHHPLPPPARPPPKKKLLRPIENLLGEVLQRSNGESVNTKSLAVEGGVLAVYFSASWCPPCKTFTPMLRLLYDEMKKLCRHFEVVYVSSDMNEQAFTEYFSQMPWLSVDWAEGEKREEIAQNFSIMGLPNLVFLDALTLNVIAKNGREIVMVDTRGEHFPWTNMAEVMQREKPVNINLRQELQDLLAREEDEEAEEAESEAVGGTVTPAGHDRAEGEGNVAMDHDAELGDEAGETAAAAEAEGNLSATEVK